jgi:hypothetical protein
MGLQENATGSSSGATSSPLSSATLRSRSLSSKQNVYKQSSTEIKNDEIQQHHQTPQQRQQQQLRNSMKILHRFKSKILLLVPTVLLAVSSIIGLFEIVSDIYVAAFLDKRSCYFHMYE